MQKILIVDDDAPIRNTLKEILEFDKYKVDEAEDGIKCMAKLKTNRYDVVILDIKMPKMDGFDVLDRIMSLAPDVPVIMISGHGSIDVAVKAVKNGAFDFIEKPLDLNKVQITIKNAINKSSLVTETRTLKRAIRHQGKIQEIIGESKAIQKIKDEIAQVAPINTRVLITGPNGTGKELVARWIHEKSPRMDKQIIEVNCAAIPSELIESELFGHEKGSFTSAIKKKLGKFELANQGTIFLDEIGDMSLGAQAKVLRALEENKITRVGGDKDIQVDVRVIAATNKNLREEIKNGNFREDLYHRLSVILIKVPPLNNRKEDIPLLVAHFIKNLSERQGLKAKNISQGALKAMIGYDWTGNVRELRNVVERLLILAKGDTITEEDVIQYVVPAEVIS